MSDTVDSADTSSAVTTETGGKPSESGSGGSQPSRSGSGRPRARRSARVTNPRGGYMQCENPGELHGKDCECLRSTPPDPGPPSFDVEAEAEDLLTDRKKLFDVLKKDLLVAYLMEVRAGKDSSANPQHARQSRKQQKELAELLARLTNETEK